MKKLLFISLSLYFAMAVVPGLSAAQDVTIDFSVGDLGDTGSSLYIHPATGLTVMGLYLEGGNWEAANLFRRNEPVDHGFGVCNPYEECFFPGGGDVNELDNQGESELIVLELPEGYKWVSVRLSSMDTNSYEDEALWERGCIYACNHKIGLPGAISKKIIDECTGGMMPVEPTIQIGPAYDRSPMLVFEPYDHSGGGNRNNDFLVYEATIRSLRDGRMTGGGSVFTVGGVRVTRGFEIHCNLAKPNNLEVNWEGNRFHLLSITGADCTDDPDIDQRPPKAPFDTFTGEGTGRLNGKGDATIEFVFVDAGEPGGGDHAEIVIRDSGGTVVLTVSGYLRIGNLQAHK